MSPAPQQEFDAAAFLRGKGLVPAELPLAVEPLTGGYWNQVLRLRGEGIDWVVKRYHAGRGPLRFPNLPDAEAAALKRLAETEAVPRLLGYFPDEADRRPVLVYDFVAGRLWDGNPAAVGAALRRVHALALPEDPHPFRRLAYRAEAMLQEVARLLDEMPAVAASARAEALRAVLPAPRALPRPRALSVVHSDLGPGNLIERADGRVVIIDWQCCGVGDPAEDLYAFLSPAFQILSRREPLHSGEQARFLVAYGDAAAEERLARLRPFYAARMLAYCAQRAVTLAESDPEAAARYARAFDAEFKDSFQR